MSVVLTLLTSGWEAKSFTDGSGWVQVTYLSKILIENIKHYYQLQSILGQAKSTADYLRLINQGIDNSVGILASLPVKDEKILASLLDFKKSLETVTDIYGKIPKSGDAAMQLLHDQSVAESLKMITSFKEYSELQEANSIRFSQESRDASPKGAARMQAQVSSEILRSLSELIRLNSQMLKLQSEQLALTNKESKDSVNDYQKVRDDFGKSFSNTKLNLDLMKF
jgi:hypothetical protein